MKTIQLSEEEIGEIFNVLDYEKDSGRLVWKDRRGGRVNVGDVAGNTEGTDYIRVHVAGRKFLAHRLAYLLVTGTFPKFDIDHINGIKTDNKWENLREATRRENMYNKKAPRTNTSGFKGVSLDKRNLKWIASIRTPEGTQFIGHFCCAEDASKAYNTKADALHKEFANNG